MIETIEDRSPRITVIVLQYAFIDIQTIFIPDLIVNHRAPLKPGPRFAVVALE
jgi:hypothetical protein